MIEILVTLVILTLGLLGLAALIIQSQRAQMESYQRSQALILLDDMAARLSANRTVASCYAVTDAASGQPNLGTGSENIPACSSGSVEAYSAANADLAQITAALTGAAETAGENQAGGLIDGRGCISFDPATGVYSLSVAWTGIVSTAPPPAHLTCGAGAYGTNDGYRRVVTTSVRLANLE